MSLIRLSKEDAKRDAGIGYTDLKTLVFVIVTAFSAYSFIQDDIKAAELRAVSAIEKAGDAIQRTQIELQLEILEDKRDRIKEKYGVPASRLGDVITPSDSAELARIERRIVRAVYMQQVLDAKQEAPLHN